MEVVWVMGRTYQAKQSEIITILDKLFRTETIIIENAETAFWALTRFLHSKADFADCLIKRSSVGAGCTSVLTFDKQAANTIGMTVLH